MRKIYWVGSLLALSLFSNSLVFADTTLDTYNVGSADTMWLISQRYGVSLSSLLAVNPQLKDVNNLQTGDVVYLPQGHLTLPSSATSSSSTATPTLKTSNPANQQYTVAAGDMLKTIAQKFNVTLSQLIAANPQIPNYDQISIGMNINIPPNSQLNGTSPISTTSTIASVVPVTGTTAANTPNNSQQYTVVAGDILKTIAQKFNVTLSQLIGANPQIPNYDQIDIGMKINIPVQTQTVSAPVSTVLTTSSSTTASTLPTPSSTTITALTVPTSSPSTTAVKPMWEQKADAIIATGMTQLGVPYVFGGDQPGVGFDCSGFTQYAFDKNGFDLLHSAALQSDLGTPVDKNNLRKGDLVFLQGTYTAGVSHVGIYLGNNQILHAGTIGTREVKISQLFGVPYYDEHYWGAKRLIND